MSNALLEQDQRFTLERDLALCAELAGVARFDLDVAACRESHCAPKYFTVRDNGLVQPWRATAVFCNPPFSDIAPWVRRSWLALARRECELIAMLLPATRTEQRWWQHDVEPYRDRGVRKLGAGGVRASLTSHFLPGRTRFGKPGNPRALSVHQVGEELGVGSPPFTCVLLVWRSS